jgi:hypothetical protein
MTDDEADGRRAGIALSLGTELFVSKKAATERIAEILQGAPLGEPLGVVERDVMIGLLLRHPRVVQKLASCVDIVVDAEPKYGGRCFWVRGHESRVDFSYRQCLNPATTYGRFNAACRNEIEEDVLDFKQRAFRDGMTCPVSGRVLSWDDCDVDHAPPRTFTVLINGFIESSGVDLAAIGYIDQGIGSVLADSRLARQWREYHNKRASLRLLSIEANRHMTAA